jgi:hypothetical protein
VTGRFTWLESLFGGREIEPLEEPKTALQKLLEEKEKDRSAYPDYYKPTRGIKR